MLPDDVELVAGLEVHIQLSTQSKLFSGDSASYGAAPNTCISPITLGHPGTLPRLNGLAVELAVRMGLVCQCAIEKKSGFARKNYFYPDLPKGFQTTQHLVPICREGFVIIGNPGEEKRIRITRIHLEEDAGKSLHDQDPEFSCIDFNRAGVALIEIVSEPDIRSGEEAAAYLTELRKLVRWLDICDGNMEEGSMRCDANVSIRPRRQEKLGTKVELKNMNSIRNVKRAIEAEGLRQAALLKSGKEILQQTRSFREEDGSSFALRTKEMADDYRYFPEPDLAPLDFSDAWVEEIRSRLPPMPAQLFGDFTQRLGLSPYDARLLTEEKAFAAYFLQIISLTPHGKAAANWMLGPVRSWLNGQACGMEEFPLLAGTIAELINMVEDGKVSFSTAANRIFPELITHPDEDPRDTVSRLNLLQDSDADHIRVLVDEVLAQLPGKVEEYRKGKKGLMGLFVGEVMKKSAGKADPVLAKDLISERIGGTK